jgi:CubicO group peptidase (beta-lactamase class C family)
LIEPASGHQLFTVGLKGSLWALGIYGQVIMVNRAEHLVIVQWSTWPQAEPSFNAQR